MEANIKRTKKDLQNKFITDLAHNALARFGGEYPSVSHVAIGNVLQILADEWQAEDVIDLLKLFREEKRESAVPGICDICGRFN